MAKIKSCQKCLLPGNVPDANLDQANVCGFCRDAEQGKKPPHYHPEEERDKLRQELDAVLKTTKGQGKYDCVICLSGGKDSAYLLYKIKKEYPNLRILTASYGMYFMQEVAKQNVTKLVNQLDVDHIFVTPHSGFQKKFYQYLLENRHAKGYQTGLFDQVLTDDLKGLCAFCSQVLQGTFIKFAFEHQIPLVLVGLSPAQPVSLFFERDANRDLTPSFMQKPPFTEEDRAYMWNGTQYPAGTKFPRMLFPFHVWDYNTDKIRAELAQEGLLETKKSASATTNCMLNLVMTHIDYNIDGYFNMLPQMCYMGRHGFVGDKEKLEWQKIAKVVSFWCPKLVHPDIRKIEKILGIDVGKIIAKYKRSGK